MRLKTNRRLILLAASAVVLAAGAFALYFVRGWQKDRMTDDFFAKGQAAFKARHYYDAMTNTAQFINRVKNSPVKRGEPRYADALLAYAESRRLIEENDSHNIHDSIAWYQQYRDLHPEDDKTSLTLLQSLNQIGMSVEARDLAFKLLRPGKTSGDDKTPAPGKTLGPAEGTLADMPILHELLLAQRQIARKDLNDPALRATIDRLLALNPLDMHANLINLEILANKGERAKARADAEALLAAHPEDPVALVIDAYSRDISLDGGPMVDKDRLERHELLCRAAGLDPKNAARLKPGVYPDELFVAQLVRAFDAAKAFDFSLAVLRDAAGQVKSTAIDRLLVRRLWQEGDNAGVLAQTAGLDPSNIDAHTELLGFRAFSLLANKQPEEAAKIAKALAAREGDFRAGGWSAAIPLIDPAATPKPAEAAAAWKAIVNPHGNPDEPVFLAYYGVALASAGRTEEARRAWSDAQATSLGASWFFPSLRIADSYLAEGRANEAVKAAEDARLIGRNRAAVIVTWFEAQAARVQQGSTADPTAPVLLKALEEMRPNFATMPDSPDARALADRLTVSYVILLALSNRSEDARNAALELIQRSPPADVTLLQRLAAISASEHLGFEDQAMQRVEAVAGPSVSVVFVKASELAAAGKPDQGLELIQAAAKQRPDDVSLQIALARFLERIGRPDATAAWVKIGDAHPDDLNVIKACLQAPSAAGDSAFIDRTIQRYTKVLAAEPGAADVIAYTARARVAMWGTPSKSDRDKAISLLDAVVRAQPSLVEPKVLLSSALRYADPARGVAPDLLRATAQLSDASAIEPANAGISLDLARLLQMQREFGRSSEILSRVIKENPDDDATRRAAAELLTMQGEPGPTASDTLTKVLASMEKKGQKPPASMLVVLAEAYLAQRQEALAAALYARLAAGAADDVDSIYSTARYYTLHSDPAKAATAIAMLDSIQTKPGTKEYARARLAADAGDVPTATTQYEAAVAAAPARSEIWRQYTQMLLRNEKYTEAAAVAKRGAAAIPADASMSALVAQVDLVTAQAQADAKPDAGASVKPRELLAALAADPAQTDAAAALREWDAMVARGQADAPAAQAALADKFPALIPLQLVIARTLAGTSPERAAAIARRAMNASPTDPTPAKAAAEIYLSMNRWQEVLAAALEWQRRDTTRSVEPDLAVAQAYLRTGQQDSGLTVLAPRVAAARADPKRPHAMEVLNIQARLLLSSGKEAQARELLAPLLPNSPTARISLWLSAAAEDAPDVQTAQAWIDQLLPFLPADSVPEHLAVVSSYPVLVARFARSSGDALREQLLGKSVAMLQKMTQDPKLATAATWETLGIVQQTRNDPKAAEEAYRKAIALEPGRSISLNNLAGIVLETDGKADEALALAQRAVQSDPGPNNLDTLASIHAAIGKSKKDGGDAAGAIPSFRAAADLYGQILKTQPSDTDALKNQAQMLDNAGDLAPAAGCYTALLEMDGIKAADAPLIRNNLAMCLVRLNSSKADLDRAISLAQEAIKLSDQPAFWDTLGWCYLAAARPKDAAAAFRSAQDKSKKPMPSAAIGLATALAGGSAEERAQARKALDTIDPTKLDKDDSERYRRAKDAVASTP